VVKVGIKDITVVVGHLAEQFESLKDKYPMIELVNNESYSRENNIASAYVVRDKLSNSYVLESDLVLYNPELIRKYEYDSNYIGYKTEYSDDWCFKVDGRYIKQVLIGGKDVYHMYGISYWSKEDGQRLSQDIATVYATDDGKQKYWDEVALKDYQDKYNIMIRPVSNEDIVEIDSYEELKILDDSYA
ncbi:MAG TPA: CTP--phosphocholine cytidylyltransferase, partial [Clostridiales bacterium]|nr:CTP--phosphocholine cytidylyltransferase [Clostridiales bacterium]